MNGKMSQYDDACIGDKLSHVDEIAAKTRLSSPALPWAAPITNPSLLTSAILRQQIQIIK